jgi:hypothetical protein
VCPPPSRPLRRGRRRWDFKAKEPPPEAEALPRPSFDLLECYHFYLVRK